jgi:hypothetical protein
MAYERLDFDDPSGFDELATRLDDIDREQGLEGDGNHLYYLATQPSAFAEIVAQLGRVGLDHERHDGGWRGSSSRSRSATTSTSAIQLNREVGKVFRESQVYRIDHYLGKETSGTCWSSGSGTGSSSRSGTAATSTMSRSPSPSRSASRAAARSTRRPARVATSSRTTSCS